MPQKIILTDTLGREFILAEDTDLNYALFAIQTGEVFVDLEILDGESLLIRPEKILSLHTVDTPE